MRKYFASIFSFLAPILRRAIIEIAADELARVAYPDRPRRRLRPVPYSDYRRPLPEPKQSWVKTPAPGYHDVLLVAFDLSGPNSDVVQKWLVDHMPPASPGRGDDDEIYLDSWWIADDDRLPAWNDDTESAVFVHKGKQEQARELLHKHGLGN